MTEQMTFRAGERAVNIRVSYAPPPIPDRNFDWVAIDDDTYDGEGCPIGYGRTKEAAVADLVEQIDGL
jgi:hypothetical protein